MRRDRQQGLGVVALKRQAAAQQRETPALQCVQRFEFRLQLRDAALERFDVARIQAQVGRHEPQPEARLHLGRRQPPHEAAQRGQFAPGQQVGCAGLHDVGRRVRVARQHRMAHGFVEVPVRLEPAPGRAMQRTAFVARQPFQARQQDLAQQRMHAIPGLAVVAADLADEQVLAIEACQPQRHVRTGVRQHQQRGAQGGAETVAQGQPREQRQLIGRQVRQHFAFEVAGKGLRVAHLHPGIRGAALGLPVDHEQLQTGHPAIGEWVFRSIVTAHSGLS
ncbi:hypothetical protein D3C71_1376470 [compost metagenome]